MRWTQIEPMWKRNFNKHDAQENEWMKIKRIKVDEENVILRPKVKVYMSGKLNHSFRFFDSFIHVYPYLSSFIRHARLHIWVDKFFSNTFKPKCLKSKPIPYLTVAANSDPFAPTNNWAHRQSLVAHVARTNSNCAHSIHDHSWSSVVIWTFVIFDWGYPVGLALRYCVENRARISFFYCIKVLFVCH